MAIKLRAYSLREILFNPTIISAASLGSLLENFYQDGKEEYVRKLKFCLCINTAHRRGETRGELIDREAYD